MCHCVHECAYPYTRQHTRAFCVDHMCVCVCMLVQYPHMYAWSLVCVCMCATHVCMHGSLHVHVDVRVFFCLLPYLAVPGPWQHWLVSQSLLGMTQASAPLMAQPGGRGPWGEDGGTECVPVPDPGSE